MPGSSEESVVFLGIPDGHPHSVAGETPGDDQVLAAVGVEISRGVPEG